MTGRRDPEASDEVVNAVLLASRVLVAIAARSLSDVAEEVTLTQFRTLVVLSTRGARSLSQLAEAVGVTPPTATRMCDRLVAKGLVRRRTESDDRRQISVDLTPAGRGLVDAVTARRRQEIRRIVGRIGVGERDVLVHALAQFADAAGEMPDQEWSIGWTGA